MLNKTSLEVIAESRWAIMNRFRRDNIKSHQIMKLTNSLVNLKIPSSKMVQVQQLAIITIWVWLLPLGKGTTMKVLIKGFNRENPWDMEVVVYRMRTLYRNSMISHIIELPKGWSRTLMFWLVLISTTDYFELLTLKIHD